MLNAINIGIWGTKGVGKTTFLRYLLLALISSEERQIGFKVQPSDSDSAEFMRTALEGTSPLPTAGSFFCRYGVKKSSFHKQELLITLNFLEVPGDWYNTPADQYHVPGYSSLADYLYNCSIIFFLIDFNNKEASSPLLRELFSEFKTRRIKEPSTRLPQNYAFCLRNLPEGLASNLHYFPESSKPLVHEFLPMHIYFDFTTTQQNYQCFDIPTLPLTKTHIHSPEIELSKVDVFDKVEVPLKWGIHQTLQQSAFVSELNRDIAKELRTFFALPQPEHQKSSLIKKLKQLVQLTPVSKDKIQQPHIVQFSAHHPKAITPLSWQPLYAYIYKENVTSIVIQNAREILNKRSTEFTQATQLSQQTIIEGTEIVATPHLDGFQFNPLRISIGFYDDWHRFDFLLRAKDAPIDRVSIGSITFTVKGIIVASVPISIYVAEQIKEETTSITQRPYQSIFCSYSHQDTRIVEQIEHVYKLLGLSYLRDITSLKSGQYWNDELLKMIEQADIFQLFWSEAAAQSEYVEKEWRHAYQLARQNFIRPVYWIEPLPKPPVELEDIHFAYHPELAQL